MIRQSLAALFLAAAAIAAARLRLRPARRLPTAHQDALKAAIAAPTRTPANVVRDRYRHPYETLAFFGVRPSDTVVEIWPGGGWYAEILAPYVARAAALIMRRHGQRDGRHQAADRRQSARSTATPALPPSPPSPPADVRVPDGSADIVLTFRNVHNWRMGYQRDGQDYSEEAFRQIFRMLRPGGTLGVVDHRLPGKRRRRARAEQRLCEGLDRPPPRRGRRLPPRRRLRDQRQPARHRRLAARGLDAAAALSARRRRTATAISRSAKATG